MHGSLAGQRIAEAFIKWDCFFTRMEDKVSRAKSFMHDRFATLHDASTDTLSAASRVGGNSSDETDSIAIFLMSIEACSPDDVITVKRGNVHRTCFEIAC